MTNYYFPTIYIVPLITLSLNVKLTLHANACLDHNSTRGLRVTFKRTKLVKPALLPNRLTIPAFISLQGGDIIL